MKVHRSYEASARGCVVAIGNFDGVHLGHKALIEAACSHAETLGAEAGVITFEPHPLQLLRPEIAPKRLTPLRAKALLLETLGVNHVYALTFNPTLRQKSPEAFVQDVLAHGLGVRHVVVGYDFRFGHKASGDVETLVTLGERFAFDVTVVEAAVLITTFAFAYGLFQLVHGPLGDRLGKLRVVCTAMFLAALASAACASPWAL